MPFYTYFENLPVAQIKGENGVLILICERLRKSLWSTYRKNFSFFESPPPRENPEAALGKFPSPGDLVQIKRVLWKRACHAILIQLLKFCFQNISSFKIKISVLKIVFFFCHKAF